MPDSTSQSAISDSSEHSFDLSEDEDEDEDKRNQNLTETLQIPKEKVKTSKKMLVRKKNILLEK